MMRRFTTLALASLAFALAASPASAAIKVTDLRGREVTLAEPARRVLLGFNYEDFMAVVGPGAMDKVAALSTAPWRDWRPRQYEAYLEAIPSIAGLPDVGDTESGTFSVEKAIAARPDLAILAAWQYDALGDGVARLEAAGIPVVVIDYNAQTLDRHIRSTLLLGAVMGADERAGKLAAAYKAAIEDTLARVAAAGPSDKKVYVELAKEGPDTVGNSYGAGMWGGVIDMVGGINIAKDQVENWGPLSPEYVLAQEPDVVVLAGSEWTAAADAVLVGFGADRNLANERIGAYLARPGWRDLPAVRNGDVHAFYHGGARTLSDYVYVQYLAKILYPDAFQDIDPDVEIRRFYETWLPVDADGVFFIQHQQPER